MFKWYSSYSVMLPAFVLGHGFSPFWNGKTFLKEMNSEFLSKGNKGINSCIWILIDQSGYEPKIFGSFNEKVLMFQNIMDDDIRNVMIKNIDTMKTMDGIEYDYFKRFVLYHVFTADSYEVVKELREHKSVIIAHVDCDQNNISDAEVRTKLSEIFFECFIKYLEG